MVSKFQSAAVEQGAAFRDECLRALRLAGFEIVDTEVHLGDVGITLDAISTNKCDISMAWEFKGSLQGTRPGLIRTDTTRKMVGEAWLLSVADCVGLLPPLFVMTSHKPTSGDSFSMLETALRNGLIADVIDSRDGMRLKWLVNATAEEIEAMIQERGR